MSDIQQRSLSEFSLSLTSALYRVTDLLAEEEPLREALRRHGMHILELASAIETIEEFGKKLKSIEYILQSISSMKNALAVAKEGGYVSRINFTVLFDEYGRLETYITKLRMPFLQMTTGAENTDISDNILKDIKDKFNKEQSSASDQYGKDEPSYESSKHTRKNSRVPSSSINERHERILLFLREQGSWMSVSDIAVLYGEGVSAKTIQRDLNDLLSRGLIIAEGERRWRRYAIIRET
ncbi:MAG: hypothetical protein COU90_01835 [Candidatus Ryanbacteria bacterium CG10_big_fil_rev_8_21_14_0_10_43_42]|uniref:HTH deoR-type domain-containing protein n=1 Tax=Candidatus Ryanbacteria bacterium CG10_big_fil_rev_8_21_14_0_10_43_42 TaxID=1974864 RepID=A0A2M8KXA3_9BACT|nr:MAG: hypothetical protein COU90_01835 [Candidatus Ryanbacteria bacterium CG10_big_fil_rev_8_21_14_0_10_43_42]